MRILGIETSCDETAAAVVEGEEGGSPRIVSNVVYSQIKEHAPYGGVVPELASREHINRIVGVVEESVEQAGGYEALDGIAVTTGPGLVGCLLVGVQTAKGLAVARGLPWLGINHLEGHLSAAQLAETPPGYPHIALVVSGGHTHLYHVERFGEYRLLGRTRDDAAGEAFDKIGKVLGVGYPGGMYVDRLAQEGDPAAFALPRPLPSKNTLDFSFSGLKTKAVQVIRGAQAPWEGQALHDFCASFQEAVADILTKKAVLAARQTGVKGIVLAGGVAANSRLRGLLEERATSAGLWAFCPPKFLCTDNGAMIAAAGWSRFQAGQPTDWQTRVRSRWPLDELPPLSQEGVTS
jgi:N6-L-threonylcarbamoyladenine synthase